MNHDEFSDKSCKIAVVGASDNKNKWGWKIYKKLKSSDFNVYPINPNHKKIDNSICYPDLKSLQEKPDIVIIVVPSKIAVQIIKECKNLGIDKVWMQPGSESEKAINICKKNHIKLIYNNCFIVDGLKRNQ